MTVDLYEGAFAAICTFAWQWWWWCRCVMQDGHLILNLYSTVLTLGGAILTVKLLYIQPKSDNMALLRVLNSLPRNFTRPMVRMAATCQQLTSANTEQFLDSIDTVLIDCDGVLWNANDPIQGAIETIQMLRERGKQPIFVTNNSTKSRRQYIEKFYRLGFTVSEDEIFGTAYVAGLYLKHKLKFEGKIYLIGGTGLAEELTLQGIPFIGPGYDHVQEGEDVHDWTTIELDPQVRGVLVGFDPLISFRKVCRAASYLSDPSVPYIATNLDGRLPIPNKGRVIPGTGCLVDAVTKAAARQPTVVGKPNQLMFQCVKEKYPSVNPARTVMVGDRLDTDILLGKNCNLKTLMVLTGISSLQDVESNQQSPSESLQKLVPDFYIPVFGNLHKLVKQ